MDWVSHSYEKKKTRRGGGKNQVKKKQMPGTTERKRAMAWVITNRARGHLGVRKKTVKEGARGEGTEQQGFFCWACRQTQPTNE